MVRGVPGSRPRLEAEHLSPDDVDVLRRDGDELAPEPVEVVAVQTPRAALEPTRVDEVRRADLGDVHLEAWVLAHEHSSGTGVVEVDVREQQVPDVGELEPLLREAGLQLGDAGRGAAVLEREPVLGLQEIDADHTLVAEVMQV